MLNVPILIGIIAVAIGFGLVQEADAQIPETGCFTANVPGETHELQNDIFGAAFSDCIYVTASNVVVDLNGMDVIGAGSGTGVLVVADGVTVMSGVPGSSVTNFDDGVLWDNALDGIQQDVDTSGNNFVGTRASGADRLQVLRTTSNGNGGAGLFIDGTTDFRVEDVETDNNVDGTGFWFSRGGDVTRLNSDGNTSSGLYNLFLEDTTIRDSIFDGNGDGVLNEDSNDLLYFGTSARNNNNHGFILTRSDRVSSEDGDWSSNGTDGWNGQDAVTTKMIRDRLLNNGGDGILFSGFTDFEGEDLVITGNTGDGMAGIDSVGAQMLRINSDNNGGNGMHFDNWDDVTCDDCGATGNSAHGVFAEDSDNLDFISGDASDNPSGDGFNISRSDGFTCVNCLSSRNGGDGRNVSDSISAVNQGGESDDNTGFGVVVVDTTGSTTEDISLVGNDGYGLAIAGGMDAIVDNIISTDNLTGGVLVTFLAENTIIQNSIISDNQGPGIHADDITDFTSINNTVTGNFTGGALLENVRGTSRIAGGSYSFNFLGGLTTVDNETIIVEQLTVIEGNQGGPAFQVFNNVLGGSATLTDVSIINNPDVAGIFLTRVADATLDQVTITGNDDGIFAQDGINLTVGNSTIDGNAGFGLNVFNYFGNVTVNATSMSNNTRAGGSVRNTSGTIRFSSVSAVSNGEGIELENNTGTVTIENSTIIGNATGGINSTGGGEIDIDSTTMDGNGGNGFGSLSSGGPISINGGSASGNTFSGIEIDTFNGPGDITSVDITGNDVGITLKQVTGGSFIISNNELGPNTSGNAVSADAAATGTLIFNNNISGDTAEDLSGANTWHLPLPDGGNWWSIYDQIIEGCDPTGLGVCADPFLFLGNQDDLPWRIPSGWLSPPDPNQPPVLDPIGDQTVNEDNELSFTATATDADLPANALTFSLDAGAPAGASIDPVTGLFSWTPSEDQGPGSFEITVRVSDDGTPSLDDSETITITVNEVNEPPVLFAIGDQAINEAFELALTATATDADLPANALTFSLDAGAPAGASIDPVTGLFAWTPSEDQGPDFHDITVRVTDNGNPALSDFETISIEVNEVNSAPVLTPIGDQTINDGDTLTLTASATDSDDPANTLEFSLDPGEPVDSTIDPTTGEFSWTSTGPGSFTVTIRVTDDGIPPLDDSETFTITVNEEGANQPPELPDVQVFIVPEDELNGFSLGTVPATDPDGDPVTFSITEGNEDGVFAIDSNTGEITVADFTQLDFETKSSFNLVVQGEDPGGLTDTSSVHILVSDVNEPPEMSNQQFNVDIDTPNFVIFGTVQATDPDAGDTLTFEIVTDVEEAFAINPNTGDLSVADSNKLDDPPGFFVIEVKVTDSVGHEVTATMDIDVTDDGEEFSTFLFEGKVTEVIDPGNLLGDSVMPGDPWHMMKTSSTTSQDVFPLNQNFGAYPYVDIHVDVNGELKFTNLPPVEEDDDICFVSNSEFFDALGVVDSTLEQISGPPIQEDAIFFDLQLGDSTGSVFDDDSKPDLELLELSNFDSTLMILGNSILENAFVSKSLLDNGQPLSEEELLVITQLSSVVIIGNVESISLIDDGVDSVVGGKSLPINYHALLLAGAQSYSWMISILLSVVVIGLYVVSRKSENS